MKNETDFYQRCYEILEKVPKGKITTYGEIARALGSNACRAVGTAMARNDKLIIRPCHRVVKSDGGIGEYALGANKKAALLMEEGVEVINEKVVDLNKFMYRFTT